MDKPTEQSSPENQPQATAGTPTREEIEVRAYEIFVERGGTHGLDMEDWLQAERELVDSYVKPVEKAKAAAGT
jgi:hypothetical protein